MRITSIEPIAVRLPMHKPVIMAGEEVKRADNVLVRIAADNGVVGWGEAAAAPVMTGDTIEGIVSAVHYLTPTLLGRDPSDIEGAIAAMDGRMYGNHGAKAAIEIALHDLAGLAAAKPVHALLGNKRRSRLPLLGVIGGDDRERDLDDAEKKKAAGVSAYKIKVGVDTAENDAARTRAICKVLGGDVLISADANQGYATEDALRYARAVEDSGLTFFEQPVDAADLAGMARIAAATTIAIGADEGVHSLEDIRRHHEKKAARGVSLKAIKLGGLRAVLQAAELCHSFGMQVNISCKTGESSVACAAVLHVAAVVPSITWALTLTHSGLAQDVAVPALLAMPGYADCIDRPGLGIAVDEDCVRHHRAAISLRHVA